MNERRLEQLLVIMSESHLRTIDNFIRDNKEEMEEIEIISFAFSSFVGATITLLDMADKKSKHQKLIRDEMSSTILILQKVFNTVFKDKK